MVEPDRSISLYVHVPFCTQKCPYCHFYSVIDDEQLKDRYLAALLSEIDRWDEQLIGRQVISIYLGGGTPLLFGARRTEAVLTKFASLSLDPSCEITIEANPETVSSVALQDCYSLGINRLSIGAQSFSPDLLPVLGRRHDTASIVRAVEQSVACGISNISLDLMYDIPGLTLPVWRETVEQACQLPVRHLSLYNLTLEPKTAWYRKKAQIQRQMPSEEVSLQMYQAAQEITERHRFFQYEISAFAKDGYVSRHNTGYWQGREFLGFGPSAFSLFDRNRFSNISNLAAYCRAMEGATSVLVFEDDLPAERRLREMVAIGLRMNKGVCLETIEKSWGPADHSLLQTLHRLEQLNLITRTGSCLALTQQGRYLYDSIASEII